MNKNGQLRVCCIVKKNWSASWIEIYTDLGTPVAFKLGVDNNIGWEESAPPLG